MGPREHLEWCGATYSGIGAPKVHFSTKMTKMPLVNPRFNRRSNKVKTLTKIYFFIVLRQTWASWRFSMTLTKFDPKSILGGPKNPNFDSDFRTDWNQCHYEDYQILNPKIVHCSKSALDRPRYHENRDDASIDAPLTFESHNFWSDHWIFKFHTFLETGS